MKKNICFAAGGTGGHLFPAQKIAQNLTDCKIIFSGMGLKDSPFLDETHNTYSLQLYGKNRLKLLWSCAAGLINAFRLLKQQKIDAVVGFGSYHCAPILLAALTLRVPIFSCRAKCHPRTRKQTILPLFYNSHNIFIHKRKTVW